MFPEWELKEGWSTVVFLLLMCLSVALSLQAAEWTEGLVILQAAVLVGGLFGIVLAKSRTPNRLAHLLSLLAGVTWGIYLTTRVLASSLDLPFEAAVVNLEGRIQAWISVVYSRGTSNDNYIFLLLLTLLMWLMAYFCAWAVFRWQRAWWAVIVAGLSLMLNLSYGPANLTGYLIAFLLFALLLVVRTSLARYEQEWRATHVRYSPGLVYGFLRTGFVLSVLAILLAWLVPEALASRPLQPLLDRATEPWRRLQDQTYRLFHDLNYQNEPGFIYFSPSMKFGGPVELSDTPVMDIEASRGRYWRVMVFHEYTSDGWLNTDPDTLLLDENDHRLAIPEFSLRRGLTQTITLHQDLGPAGTIAAAAQPLRVALPLRALVNFVEPEAGLSGPREVGSLRSLPGDPSVLHSRTPLKAGDSYQAYSSLTYADAASLRMAGTDYPVWVVPRYLQLSELLPQRVRDLAEELTADQETPYDKALAVEQYLRKIPYNEYIAGPQPGQDGVDYFLFDAREGYCNYYASAMVVMLRSVGVPARYVQGYGQGEREAGVYHVLESNGHAWPEVFFPEYGWIEFEPTAGEPALLRAEDRNNSANSASREPPRPEFERMLDEMIDTEINPDVLNPAPTPGPQAVWERVGRWVWLAVALVATCLLALLLLSIRRRRRIEGLSAVERVYDDLVNWARRLLRIEPLTHQTPHEYAGVVARDVPKGRQAVERIADLYTQERFGAKEVSSAPVEVAWNQVRPALWHRWLERKTERVWRLGRWPGSPGTPPEK
jgi:transglutaminase-like putative cysteine protease